MNSKRAGDKKRTNFAAAGSRNAIEVGRRDELHGQECVLRFRSSREDDDCRIVELRASCNEVPRTPPGPEGSNGTG